MFRHYRVILTQLVIYTFPSYTSISNAAVGNTIKMKLFPLGFIKVLTLFVDISILSFFKKNKFFLFILNRPKTQHRIFGFANKYIKIIFFCGMTQCHCVIFSRRFQTVNLSWQFRNRASADVASYLKGKETSHTALRVYRGFHISRHLKICKLSLRLKR
jgi:hypothetical protein